ncbi:MAG: MBL fold metallo-hydrolase [Acidobacteriaceae bacterium]
MPHYNFARNNPYDRQAPVEPLLPALMPSAAYMQSIRAFDVPEGALAIWYFGQNGFILKTRSSPLLSIDLYLSDSCAERFASLPFRLNRQLPVFVEPEDLDVDIFLTTHSHDDHADPETIRRLPHKDKLRFVGPWEAVSRYVECGVPAASCTLLHPNQTLDLDGLSITGTFALPTDATDLNHSGVLLRFPGGITFYNTGDTAYCGILASLLPRGPDLCAVCINGGFNNLSAMQAAHIVCAVQPRIAIPCHYDMMINNVGDPEMFRAALHVVGSPAEVRVLDYYEPWIYAR